MVPLFQEPQESLSFSRSSEGLCSLEQREETAEKSSHFFAPPKPKKLYSPERHGERGQRAPGAPAAASRENADEGRDGREEQEAEDDVAFLFF